MRILAAIAAGAAAVALVLPVYRTYAFRATVAEVIREAVACREGWGRETLAPCWPRYAHVATVAPVEGGDALLVTLSAAAGDQAGRTIMLRRSGPHASITCRPGEVNGLDPRYLPVQCQP